MNIFKKFWKSSDKKLSPEKRLDKAILYTMTGDIHKGRKILRQLLKEDKDNQSAWYWLSKATKNRAERILCLEKALEINPEHSTAQQELKRLKIHRQVKQESSTPLDLSIKPFPKTLYYRYDNNRFIPGMAIKAFVRNQTHFLKDYVVFQDGKIYVWGELISLQKLNNGWISGGIGFVTSLPEEADVGLTFLARFTATNVTPLIKETQFIDQIIYEIHRLKQYSEAMDTNQFVSLLPGPMILTRDVVFRVTENMLVPGKKLEAFKFSNDTYLLIDVTVFQDMVIGIEDEFITFEQLKDEIGTGQIVTSIPEGANITIPSLVNCIAEQVGSWVKEEEFIKEVVDIIESLNGRPSASEVCKEALKKFQEEMTEEARQELRQAYEAVPAHNRKFLGDMDVKDIPIRMIIYGEDEIENWSHRLLAKKLEMSPLPNIKVKGALPSRKKTED